MDLAVWTTEQEKQYQAFFKWWLIQYTKDQDNYPMDLDPGEWDEQFRSWLSIGNGS